MIFCTVNRYSKKQEKCSTNKTCDKVAGALINKQILMQNLKIEFKYTAYANC